MATMSPREMPLWDRDAGRLPRRAAAPPPEPAENGVAAIVLGSTILFCHLGSALGQVIPLVSTLAALLLLVVRRRQVVARGLGFGWIAAYALFAMLSALWSDSRSSAAYYGFQLLLTAFCAYALWATLDARGFIRVIFIASLLICLVSIATGETQYSKMSLVLTGVTGSKNAMSAAGHLALLSSLGILLDRGQALNWKPVAAFGGVVGVYIVATNHAATMIILAAMAPPLFILFALIGRFRVAWRLPLLAAALLAATPAIIFHSEIEDAAQDYLFTTFDKDQSLTGRTYLWEVAQELIAMRPIGGWGYKAVWSGSAPQALGALRSQNITDPKSFSFHQTYLEARVDTGIVGYALIIAVIGFGTIGATMRAVYQRGVPVVFVAVLLIGLLVRSFTDNLVGPFYGYFTLLTAAAGYGIFGPRCSAPWPWSADGVGAGQGRQRPRGGAELLA